MANAWPLGSNTIGPISGTIPKPPLFGRRTFVLPALTHFDVAGRNFSACVPFSVSTVSTLLSGSSAQPSSEKLSFLPEPTNDQLRFDGSKAAVWVENALPIRNVPSGSTIAGESPIFVHPLGGFTVVHVFVVGS